MSLNKLLSIASLCALLITQPSRSAGHDDFQHLVEVNKASLVMLVEQDLLPRSLASRIAAGILQIDDEQSAEGSRRSANYLDFEARLLEIAGSEASRLHTGRSRQDIGSTLRRLALREAELDVYEALLEARDVLLGLAAQHVETVIPAYTHGVQAQPTSLAHYLLAFSSAFGRDAERYRQSFDRMNRSPLGAAALGTSGFPVDRPRLAELLGFAGVVDNSYDANLVSSVDSKIEFANAMSVSAVPVGQFMQNLHTQYHGTAPWFLLAEGETDVSSIMPQKRNPRPIDRVRTLATGVIGGANLVTLNAHNTNSGMNDYRPATQALETADTAIRMYEAYVRVIHNLVISPDHAQREIDSEYSTMTEVADVLLRHAEVPFRVAHHYASELTTYGRAHEKRPKDLTDDELESIYREAIGEELPVDVSLIHDAMDPAAMVRNRRGQGGPQPDEVRRMLDDHAGESRADREWLRVERMNLERAGKRLATEFAALAGR